MPRKVTVNTGFSNVSLPNGLYYNAGDTVVLTDEQGAKLLDTVFTKTVVASDGVARPVLVDNGSYGLALSNSGLTRPTVTGVTAVAVTGATGTSTTPYGYATLAQANAIVTAVNALVTDVTNIRAEVLSLANIVAGAGIAAGSSNQT